MAVVICGLFVACGGDDDAESTSTSTDSATATEESAAPTDEPSDGVASPTPGPTEAVTVVVVDMTADELIIDVTSGPAGAFSFDITNEGEDVRPFQIIKTDEPGVPLSTTTAGDFDPAGGTAYIVAQTPGMAGGSTTTMGSRLEAGSYVFIAGGVDAEGNGHYGNGVFAGFAVE